MIWFNWQKLRLTFNDNRLYRFLKRIDFLRVLRATVVIAGLFSIGCVPIRQYMGGNSPAISSGVPKSQGGTKTEFENPDDFKTADKDAWKDEMEGIASWYGVDFNGRLTANGEVYDMYKYTAAHKTLPLGTVVKVTNLENGMSAEVRVNDRGPYVKSRIIDLSRTAGRAIGMRAAGTAKVKLEIVRWPQKEN